jgi:hypothetical protein
MQGLRDRFGFAWAGMLADKGNELEKRLLYDEREVGM